jgi:hypothetical protein
LSVYNGIYIVQPIGVMQRAEYYNTSDIMRGSLIRVLGGIKNGGKTFKCANINPFTVDRDYIKFIDTNAIQNTIISQIAYISWDRGNDFTGIGSWEHPFYSIAQALKSMSPALSTSDLNKIKIRFAVGGTYYLYAFSSSGTWAIGTTYAENLAYTYSGNIYRSKVSNNVGNTPTLIPATDNYWELMTYDVGATYAKYKVIQYDTTQADGSTLPYLYRSKIDNNIGNAITDINSWEIIGLGAYDTVFNINVGQTTTNYDSHDAGNKIMIMPVYNAQAWDSGTTYHQYDVAYDTDYKLWYSNLVGDNLNQPIGGAGWTQVDIYWENLYHAFTDITPADATFSAISFKTSPTTHTTISRN